MEDIKKDKRKKHIGPTGLQDEINRRIRRNIRCGIYKPGEKLPSRVELQSHYDTTPVTIQRAFDKMNADGFIRSDGQRGTFVADYPPCLNHYAVVFPHHFNASLPEVNFWRVLVQETKLKSKKSNYTFTLYTALNGHTDEPDYARLFNDLQSDRLAGIIFASSPHLLVNTPLFKEIMARTEVPKVAFMTASTFTEIPIVSSESKHSFHLVFDFLKDKGKQLCNTTGSYV